MVEVVPGWAGILQGHNENEEGRSETRRMDNVFRTTSMPAAAFLIAKGASLPRVEPTSDPRHFELLFADPDGIIGQTIAEYFRGDVAPARDFYRSLQDLRFHINRAKGGAR